MGQTRLDLSQKRNLSKGWSRRKQDVHTKFSQVDTSTYLPCFVTHSLMNILAKSWNI